MRPVFLAGAAGKMGKEAVSTLIASEHYNLQAAFTFRSGLGKDAAHIAGLSDPSQIIIESFSAAVFEAHCEHVQRPLWLDLSVAKSAYAHAKVVIPAGVPMVIGATGFSVEQLTHLSALAQEYQTGVLLAPNFSIGALLMMRFAQAASKHFNWAEIIELHHDKKKDAPSGTAHKTADLMNAANPNFEVATPDFPARGALYGGIPIHSIRLPGLLAHQEVILGGVGQTLTLRHDSLDRASFMPGVLLALDSVEQCNGLVNGLESFI